MKKRMLAMLLTLCMVITLLPVTGHAASSEKAKDSEYVLLLDLNKRNNESFAKFVEYDSNGWPAAYFNPNSSDFKNLFYYTKSENRYARLFIYDCWQTRSQIESDFSDTQDQNDVWLHSNKNSVTGTNAYEFTLAYKDKNGYHHLLRDDNYKNVDEAPSDKNEHHYHGVYFTKNTGWNAGSASFYIAYPSFTFFRISETEDVSTTRLAAVKAAVHSFLEQLKNNPKAKVQIIGFAGRQAFAAGKYTFVSTVKDYTNDLLSIETNYDTLVAAVDDLALLNMEGNITNEDRLYSYTSEALKKAVNTNWTTDARTVVLFQSHNPSKYSTSDSVYAHAWAQTDAADDAIAQASNLKKKNVSVYSIGLLASGYEVAPLRLNNYGNTTKVAAYSDTYTLDDFFQGVSSNYDSNVTSLAGVKSSTAVDTKYTVYAQSADDLDNAFNYVIEQTETFDSTQRALSVTVNAEERNETGVGPTRAVPVPDATVTLFVGTDSKVQGKTNSNGVCMLNVSKLSESELSQATISASKTVSVGTAANGNGRDALYAYYPKDTTDKDDDGNSTERIRYEYQLHSETIDSAGIWRGVNYSDVEDNRLVLTLKEPRIYYNLSVCYLANDKTSKSDSYKGSLKKMLKEYSKCIAQATDGHVMIGKVVLFSTSSLMNFFDPSHFAAMSDIHIETRVKDDGVRWHNVKVHSNSNRGGFYHTDQASSQHDIDHFSYLKDADTYKGGTIFPRIQLSGTMDESDFSFIKNPVSYAKTVTHESGHYLLFLYDEYGHPKSSSDESLVEWNKKDRPYANFGLMDYQYTDVELSNMAVDYAGLACLTNKTAANSTKQYYFTDQSCEDRLETILTGGIKIGDWSLVFSPYAASYDKVKAGENRTAAYSYSELSDDDFLLLPSSAASLFSGEEITEDYFDDLRYTTEELGEVRFDGSEDSVAVTVSGGGDYALYCMRAADDGYAEIELTEVDGVRTGTLPLEDADLAELRLVSADTQQYNILYLDRTGKTDVGYLYHSADNCVEGYVSNDEEASYLFEAVNLAYENGDYVSVNQALRIIPETDAAITGGEIYSVAARGAEIDYSTLTWFKQTEDGWRALTTDCTRESNGNIGVRGDLDGAGLYALMAQRAKNTEVLPVTELSYTQSQTNDALVTLRFADPNETSKFYQVYYSENPISDTSADDVMMKFFDADSPELTLDLVERGSTFYAAVEVILEDGSRSALSTITLTAGEADSDGDGIPDWYCSEHLLWPDSGEEKDIAASDDDGDGYTNLQEYQMGTDPRDPESPAVGRAAVYAERTESGVSATVYGSLRLTGAEVKLIAARYDADGKLLGTTTKALALTGGAVAEAEIVIPEDAHCSLIRLYILDPTDGFRPLATAWQQDIS